MMICLKNDDAFALLTTIFPHTIAMFNEIYHFLGLYVILNAKIIGLGNCANQYNGNNIGESSSIGDNRS
jgi:hypothetical protein